MSVLKFKHALLTVAMHASDSAETKPLIFSANQGDLENSRHIITGYAEITVHVDESVSIEPVEVVSANIPQLITRSASGHWLPEGIHVITERTTKRWHGHSLASQ